MSAWIVCVLGVLLLCGVIGGATVYLRGAKRVGLFGLYFGLAGGAFLILGFVALAMDIVQYVTTQVVLGMVLVLAGIMCLMATQLHLEITRLRDRLDKKETD